MYLGWEDILHCKISSHVVQLFSWFFRRDIWKIGKSSSRFCKTKESHQKVDWIIELYLPR